MDIDYEQDASNCDDITDYELYRIMKLGVREIDRRWAAEQWAKKFPKVSGLEADKSWVKDAYASAYELLESGRKGSI